MMKGDLNSSDSSHTLTQASSHQVNMTRTVTQEPIHGTQTQAKHQEGQEVQNVYKTCFLCMKYGYNHLFTTPKGFFSLPCNSPFCHVLKQEKQGLSYLVLMLAFETKENHMREFYRWSILKHTNSINGLVISPNNHQGTLNFKLKFSKSRNGRNLKQRLDVPI